ncbi:hypothetical protein EK21DRAFT_54099 [Setomelanomma holmii]|uniref:Uncharacterized protein n=1 Tax=Setomelanomma holmii TaxID=210430 RepID=A0A9P4HJU6_9PLEO|nr:hypothetical protein EK21DRAFT_54099 [Setomelanomma holmii]
MRNRTIEVGRAVLASSAQNLELWLTNLITISPKQHSLEHQQLTSTSLIELLSFGSIWVGRGTGMRVKFTVTLQGDPLPHKQMQDLIHDILEAPVWVQLRLKPGLPDDVELQDGIAHLKISHAEFQSVPEEKRSHRIFPNVPAAAVQPPDGVPSVDLQVVHFRIDILEQKQRRSLKRSRTSSKDNGSHRTPETASRKPDGLPDTIPRESTSDSAAWRECQTNIDGPASTSTCQSRKRPRVSVPTAIRVLIDGAMRLAVLGQYRSSKGVKVKANTFGGIGLAGIAPSLWKPGYLAALAQRAHLLPTISQSLGRTAGPRVSSISLRTKLESLSTISPVGSVDILQDQAVANERKAVSLSNLSTRLWIHAQKNLLSRPIPPLHAFIDHDTTVPIQAESDELLEHLCDSMHGEGGRLDGDDDDTAGLTLENNLQQQEFATPLGTSDSLFEDSELVSFGHERISPGPRNDVLSYGMPIDKLLCADHDRILDGKAKFHST